VSALPLVGTARQIFPNWWHPVRTAIRDVGRMGESLATDQE
jgi:hypothetical protein